MDNKIVWKKEAVAVMPTLKKAAAYARVSTGKGEMIHSLAAQVDYYRDYIRRQPGWVFVGVYSDEAMTGTKNNRPQFRQMIEDCRNGRIDIVITKAVSRFARNTVDLLETVRELKSYDVDVFFEEQNIHTMSAEGELMLTIIASCAEEESLSASENCKWRIKKNFQHGIPQSVSLMGYQVRKGQFRVIPEEAAVVRMIFQDYLDGMGINAIQRKLAALNIRSKQGKDWHQSIIAQMLCNEKYAGDLMMQKYIRPDHLTKIDYVNKGRAARYFVQDHHEAIIDRETFDAVQGLLEKRQRHNEPSEKGMVNPFTGKVVCENCKKHYRRKTINGKKYLAVRYLSKAGESILPCQAGA